MRQSATLLLCALALPVFAVHNDRRFERIGTTEGLSEPSVTAIAQDRRGFLWFGTNEGLNRFEGTSMTVYRRDPTDPSTIPSNRVSALLIDSRGTMWVGTRGGGLARFDATTERFETFRFDPDDALSVSQNDVYSLVEDRRGTIWVGTGRGGLNRVDLSNPARPRFIRYQHDAKNPDSLSDDRTRALLVDARDRLWVATMGGINRLEGEVFVQYRHDAQRPDSISDDEVWALEQDRDGTLWAGTWGGGLSRLDADAMDVPGGRFVNIRPNAAEPFSLSDDRVMVILEDKGGTLWICTKSQLNELLPSEKRKDRPRFIRHANDLDSPHSLSGDEMAAAFEDGAGDLWFGTIAGASHIDRSHQMFERLHQAPADPRRIGPGNGVHAFLEDRRGAFWIGTGSGLVRVVRSGDRFAIDTITHFTNRDGSGFAGESALAVVEDRLGTIWIGTTGGGLLSIPAEEAAKEKPTIARLVPDPAKPNSLASDAILSLITDANGQLWVGTYRGLHRALPEGGFARYQNNRSEDSTLSADTIGSLAAAPDGTLWVGTYRGLNHFNPATGKVVRYLPDPLRPHSLSHEFINDVDVDRNGDLWVSTWGGGLCRLRKGAQEFELFGTREGLPSETVQQVSEGRDGMLWIATSRGLVRRDPRTGAMRIFDSRDGLHGDSLATLAWRRDGALVVGGATGLTFFDPRALPRDAQLPPVVLTGLRVLNRAVPIGGEILSKAITFADGITLGPRHYLFAVDFTTLTYRSPEKLRYAYRLDGFDRDWRATDANDRKAVYSNVPPGSYVFRVRAMNADGAWSDHAAAMPVTVLPPWWKTWWARTAALLLLVIAIVSWPLVHLARQRRISAILETKVAERTAQLEEANHRLDFVSRTDPLTKLPNRRHFLEKADELIALSRRNGRPLAIALADVDNFKSVNDTRGHDVGDAVLCSVADALRDALRKTDLLARWGGEEFIFLLPDTDSAAALEVAEKVRAAVAGGASPLPVTITIGVATIDTSMPLEQCSIRADAALYEGKRSGKNKVVLAA